MLERRPISKMCDKPRGPLRASIQPYRHPTLLHVCLLYACGQPTRELPWRHGPYPSFCWATNTAAKQHFFRRCLPPVPYLGHTDKACADVSARDMTDSPGKRPRASICSRT